MQLLSTLAVMASVSLASAMSTVTVTAPPSTVSTATVQAASADACDAYCRSRLFYQTAFSAANLGASETLKTYGIFDWCSNTDGCPDLVDRMISNFAGAAAKIKTPAQCGADCMVSSLSSISSKATMDSIGWVLSEVEGNGTLAHGVDTHSLNQTKVNNLHRLRAHLKASTARAPALNRTALDSVMMSPAVPLATASSLSQREADDDKKYLGFLAVPVAIAPLALIGANCRDPVLCSPKSSEYVSRVIKGAKEALPESDILQPMIDRASDASSISSGSAPKSILKPPPEPESEFQRWMREKEEVSKAFEEASDVASGEAPTWAEAIASEGLEAGKLFRTERFNPETQVLEQQVLKYAGKQLEEGLWHGGRGIDAARMLDNGYRPFEMLSAEGKVLKLPGLRKMPDEYQRFVWQRPEDLKPMPQDWSPTAGNPDVQIATDEAAISSQGEPIVGTSGSPPTLQSLEAVDAGSTALKQSVKFSDQHAFKVIDPNGKFLPGSDGSDAVVFYKPDAELNASKMRHNVKVTTLQQIEDAPPDEIPSDGPIPTPAGTIGESTPLPPTNLPASTVVASQPAPPAATVAPPDVLPPVVPSSAPPAPTPPQSAPIPVAQPPPVVIVPAKSSQSSTFATVVVPAKPTFIPGSPQVADPSDPKAAAAIKAAQSPCPGDEHYGYLGYLGGGRGPACD